MTLAGIVNEIVLHHLVEESIRLSVGKTPLVADWTRGMLLSIRPDRHRKLQEARFAQVMVVLTNDESHTEGLEADRTIYQFFHGNARAVCEQRCVCVFFCCGS